MMSSLGIEPRMLALQTSMHPLHYGTLTRIIQKLFDCDYKRVGQKEPPRVSSAQNVRRIQLG